VFYLRKADNIRIPQEWTVLRVELEGETIVSAVVMQRGRYSLDGFPGIGGSLDTIRRWVGAWERLDARKSPPGAYYQEVLRDGDHRWLTAGSLLI